MGSFPQRHRYLWNESMPHEKAFNISYFGVLSDEIFMLTARLMKDLFPVRYTFL